MDMVTHTPPRTDVFPSVTVTIFAVPSDMKTHASHKNPFPSPATAPTYSVGCEKTYGNEKGRSPVAPCDIWKFQIISDTGNIAQ
jgi:hypothetical protein